MKKQTFFVLVINESIEAQKSSMYKQLAFEAGPQAFFELQILMFLKVFFVKDPFITLRELCKINVENQC